MEMQIEFPVTGLKRARRRRKPAHEAPPISPAVRSIVLAFQIEQAVWDGRARDYADVARQIGWTRARVSQIVRLLKLSPEILNALLLADPLSLPHLTERQLRPLVDQSASIDDFEELKRRLAT